jgi:L-ascorbate metabolism protein UlaG (beta-lactamase superfamily)
VTAPIDVAWLGHATVDLRLAGRRFLTDPVLRDRLAHLRRLDGTGNLDPGPIDAVLYSHLHHDHLDVPSLRRLGAAELVVVPRGAGRLVARHTRADVVEVRPDDELTIGDVHVRVIPADHTGGRTFRRVAGPPLGYLFEAPDATVYFPGDTDLHPVMGELPAPDLALLPIWGWGPQLGPGHLDPHRAAEAARLLRARAVLPVHWGTFAPVTTRRQAAWVHAPADAFAGAAAEVAPDTRLHVVRPGPARLLLPAG